jgi:hypothetical protein
MCASFPWLYMDSMDMLLGGPGDPYYSYQVFVLFYYESLHAATCVHARWLLQRF